MAVTRSRCAPRHPHPADPDPERTAERWAELAGRVRDRTGGAGVPGLVHSPVWQAAADPDTWSPGPTWDDAVAGARILGGRDSGYLGAPDPQSLSGGRLVGVLALWQRDPVLGHLPARSILQAAGVAGAPPGSGTTDPGTPVGGALVHHVRTSHYLNVLLGLPAGAATECLLVATRNLLLVPAGMRPAVRAVVGLLGGDIDARVGDDGTILTRDPTLRGSGDLHVNQLVTTDPRLARRFLEIFDWHRWLTAPGGRQVVAVYWVAAVAPADRHTRRILGELVGTVAPRLVAGVVVPALRAVGMEPVVPGPGSGASTVPVQVPVLWWRRAVRGVLAHPDRIRAVDSLVDSWVRVGTGR